MPRAPTVVRRFLWYSTGSPFYSVNINHVYWHYDSIAQTYPGYTLQDIRSMSVRQRSFWSEMSRWHK